MKSVRIHLEFTDIEGVSDRTARDILKALSQICRRAQIAEIFEILRDSDISSRERQSLNDKLRHKIEAVPVYYLNYAKKGSFIVDGTIAGLTIYLLQNTLGESLKEAWKQIKLHQHIIEFLTTKRETVLPALLAREARSVDILSGRIKVDRTDISEDKKSVTLNVWVVPDEDVFTDYPALISEKTLKENGEGHIKFIRED